MIKITGLDTLSRQLKDASAALQSLDGKLGTVNFTADDPASIEAAIQSVNNMIDARIAPYHGNPIIEQLADDMKERFRADIIERAAAERLKDGN